MARDFNVIPAQVGMTIAHVIPGGYHASVSSATITDHLEFLFVVRTHVPIETIDRRGATPFGIGVGDGCRFVRT